MLRNFHGGVHPHEGKTLSEDKPVKYMNAKVGDMVFPVSQHIGAPANPIVNVGDRVLKGQIIAEAQGMISANILTSVSGTVKKIEDRLLVNGSTGKCIIIENDGLEEAVPEYGVERDATALTKEEIRQIVKDAGIVGLGGAAFPTHVKLTPKNEDAIDTIIVNGAECEPYLTSDYRMMIEKPEEIIAGLKIILQLFPGAKGVIGIEDNKPAAIKKMEELTASEPDISVAAFRTRYPQGAERSMIYAITGREINSSMLPADAGCIVDNVDTVRAIYNAVAKRQPLLTKVVTVTGDAVNNPQNFCVPLGMMYTEILEEAGGFKGEPEKLISGGPMMGQALFSIDVPVAKNTSSLTCFTKDPLDALCETPCIRCGKCVTVCPSRLVPEMMMTVALRKNVEGFEALEGMECIECGCCSYTCPANRPLTQTFKEFKRVVTAERRNRAEKEKAEKAQKEEAQKKDEGKEVL